MDKELLQNLTELYIWGNPKFFKNPDIISIKVVWFSYYNTWRATILTKHSTGEEPERKSSDPVCRYIIDKCFDKATTKSMEVHVAKPSNHEFAEAVLELQELLNLEGQEMYAK